MYIPSEEMTVEVNHCFECPFMISARDTEQEYCTHPLIQPDKFDAMIKSPNEIPGWCPLIQYSVTIKLIQKLLL